MHYQRGGRQPIENKPLKKTFFDENLKRYLINFLEHEFFTIPEKQWQNF